MASEAWLYWISEAHLVEDAQVLAQSLGIELPRGDPGEGLKGGLMYPMMALVRAKLDTKENLEILFGPDCELDPLLLHVKRDCKLFDELPIPNKRHHKAPSHTTKTSAEEGKDASSKELEAEKAAERLRIKREKKKLAKAKARKRKYAQRHPQQDHNLEINIPENFRGEDGMVSVSTLSSAVSSLNPSEEDTPPYSVSPGIGFGDAIPEDEETLCAVCLDDISYGCEGLVLNDVQLLCNHRFHMECLFQQYQRGMEQLNCPLCSKFLLNESGRLMGHLRTPPGQPHTFGWHDVGSFFESDLELQRKPQKVLDEETLLAMTTDGDVEGVRIMLDEGTCPNASYLDGTSALTLALHGGNFEIVRMLLERGGIVGPNEQTALRHTMGGKYSTLTRDQKEKFLQIQHLIG